VIRLTPSQMLAAGVGDANVETLFSVSVTVTETQRTAVREYLARARRDLADAITAPTCSPADEEWMTRALAVIALLAGRLAQAQPIPLPRKEKIA
jgi:glycerol dehydrogenase-like iron-containing ADH family enzyme